MYNSDILGRAVGKVGCCCVHKSSYIRIGEIALQPAFAANRPHGPPALPANLLPANLLPASLLPASLLPE